MFRKLFLVALLAIIVSMPGCGDIKKIKDVKKVALAGVTFRKNIVSVDAQGNEAGGVDLFSIGQGGAEFGPVDAEVEAYYKTIINRLSEVLKSHGVTVIPATEFSENDTFKQLHSSPAKGDIFSAEYSPEPFKSGNVAQDGALVTKLAEELDVDAVAFFTIYAVKIKETAFLIMPAEKLGLRGKLTMIHKDGDLIIGHQIFTAEAEGQIEWGNIVAGAVLGDGANILEISPQNREMFDLMSQRFINKVSDYIREGKK